MNDPMTAGFRRLAEAEEDFDVSAGGPPFRELLRSAAADAEDGMPVSAGARLTHGQQLRDAAKVLSVDLSRVPEAKRAEVIAAIRELVGRAGTNGVPEPAAVGS